MPTQLPFFVAACDYTLIGEELFAASAYLSKDKKMLGSLKGQDAGKAIAMGHRDVGNSSRRGIGDAGHHNRKRRPDVGIRLAEATVQLELLRRPG